MRLKAGLIFLGATCGIFSIGYAFAPPAHSLPLFNHTSAAGLSNAHCLSGDAWAVTLTITATNPELGPVADITYTGNDIHGVDLTKPYVEQFTTQAPSWTASAHIVWSDGFTQDKGPFVATRPDGCTPPPTSGTTTTTTCAQAIPPRSDCAPITEVTTSTSTSSPVSIGSVPPMTPSSAPSTVPTTSPSASVASSSVPHASSTASPYLPVTGTGSTIVWVAVAILAVGTAAILITVRRRRP